MKETLLRNARYNAWANGMFLSILHTLDEDILDKEIISSFSSIRKTVYHVWGAEDIWLQRLHRVEKPIWKAISFNGSFAEVCLMWAEASQGLISYLVDFPNDRALTETIPVVNMKGELYDDAIVDILQHVFNHSTYHRGQLVTMLRQAGLTSIPQTDMIAFTRQSALTQA
jgi:uncharacterized damage-inducible protein DinB